MSNEQTAWAWREQALAAEAKICALGVELAEARKLLAEARRLLEREFMGES